MNVCVGNPVAMSSFEVFVFTDMTHGPILHLGTCNYVELEGVLKYNISVCVCACVYPCVCLSVSKLNSMALSFSCFSCFQWQIL